MVDERKEAQGRIAQAREEVSGSLAELAGEVRRLVDLRAWVRREPWVFMAGAAALGFLLSARPKGLSAVLGKLLPIAALAAARPMLERVGEELGSSLMQRRGAST